MKESRQPAARHLLAATIVAAAVIVWGALFLIAPVWQFPDRAAAYQVPAAVQAPAPEEALTGPIDVNTADAQLLMELPGIGPVKADAIIAYREEHGPFASLDELDEVKGISARMVESWAGLAVAGTQRADDADTN